MRCCRGFAVVFAEDVPDVPSQDNPPGKLPSRRCPSLLIRTCLVFRGLGSTLPRLQFLPQRDRILLIARSTTADVYTTKLCLESYWPLLSFAVVTFRIIKSIQPPPRRSFVNCRCSIPYQTWKIQFSFEIVAVSSNASRLAVLPAQNKAQEVSCRVSMLHIGNESETASGTMS